MKIYNEIVWRWNEETQKLEEIYSDSFDYDGDIDQLQYGGGGSSGGGGGTSGGNTGGSTPNPGANNDTTQNTDDEYSQLWHNENVEEYKKAVSSRITELVLSKLTQIQELVDKSDIEGFQKTFKDGVMTEGRSGDEMMVVYQSDVDATKHTENVLNTILNWANFVHPSQIQMDVTTIVTQGVEGTEVSEPLIQLTAPNDNPPLDIVNLYGNLSQFFNIDAVKTQIDNSKLPDLVSMDFSEITPETFTTILDKYRNFKTQLPFFRYRTDDFFDEYAEAPIPQQYRLQKFFEEFERIKEDIPAGSFGFEAVTVKAEGTGFYLFNEDGVGTGRLPRKLSIITKDGIEKPIYSQAGGRGHRITILAKNSFVGGDWNGLIKYDEEYDTYGGRSHFPGQNSQFYGEETADKLADVIINGQFEDGTIIDEDDLIIITSFDAVRYTPKLIEALQSIGASSPRVIEPETPVNISGTENLSTALKARYNFNQPDNKNIGGGGPFQAVQPQVYSSVSQFTKPRHIITNPLGNVIWSHSEDGNTPQYMVHPARNFDYSPDGVNTVTNELGLLGSGLVPGNSSYTVKQTRGDEFSEYQIAIPQLKGGCTYTFRVWMCSPTYDDLNLSDTMRSFNPFHIRAFSRASNTSSDNVVNHPITGDGGEDSVVNTKEYTYMAGDLPKTRTWYHKEIKLTTPMNHQAGGGLDWYVGYKGFGENEPKPSAEGGLPQDVIIHFTGFEIFEDVEEYNGYYQGGNYLGAEKSAGTSGQFHETYFKDISGLNNRLQVIGNNINWLYTSARGFTPIFGYGPNEHMIQRFINGDKTSFGDALTSSPDSVDEYLTGEWNGGNSEPQPGGEQVKNNPSAVGSYPVTHNPMFEPGEQDVTIQMDLYIDADYYEITEWEEYIGNPSTLSDEYGPALMDTAGMKWKSMAPGLQKIVEFPNTLGLFINGSSQQAPLPLYGSFMMPGELGIKINTANMPYGIGNLITWNNTLIRTHYQLPLKQWVNIAFTFNGSRLKFYVDGLEQFNISRTGKTPFLNAAEADAVGGTFDGIPGYRGTYNGYQDAISDINYNFGGKKMSLDGGYENRSLLFGDRAVYSENLSVLNGGGRLRNGGMVPVNVSLDRFYLYTTILNADQIYSVANNPFTELGDNVQRSPYSFIGSKLFDTSQGVEDITEASPDGGLAQVTKMWPPDVEYTTWENNTAGYIISELQKTSNEELPIYSSNQVSNMVNEMNSLKEQKDVQANLIATQQTQIGSLEDSLSTIGQANNEFHGDCESVSGGYGCEDNVSYPNPDVNIFVTCTDGAVLPLYCTNPLENTDELCDSQPTYPYGGPISGQNACEGV